MKTQATHSKRQLVNLQPKAMNKLPHLFALALIALCTTMSQSAYAAGPLNPVQLANEVMMHAQGQAGQVIASRVGVDPKSPLSYSTYVDPNGQSFTFALKAGSTYLGQPINLIADGALNPSTQTWGIASYVSYGGSQWTVTTSMVPSISTDTSAVNFTSRTRVDSGGAQSLTVTHPWDGVQCWLVYGYSDAYGRSLEQCQAYWQGQPAGPPYGVYDGWPYDPFGSSYPWWWELNLEPFGYSISLQGFTLKAGGDGSSTMRVGPAQPGCVNCGSE